MTDKERNEVIEKITESCYVGQWRQACRLVIENNITLNHLVQYDKEGKAANHRGEAADTFDSPYDIAFLWDMVRDHKTLLALSQTSQKEDKRRGRKELKPNDIKDIIFGDEKS